MSDALSAEVPSAADVARTAEEAARFLSSRRPRRSKPENIMRVAQLDAVQLDQELLNMLRESLQRSAAYLPSAAADRFAPELESLLYLLLWLFSIRENRPSPGNAMQNLRYCNNVPMKGKSDHMMRWWQRLGHGAATVLFRWLWLRMSRTATENAWMDRAESSLQFRTYALMQALEKLYRVCSVVNLVVFLRTGRYRSLLDRVLRMRLVYARRDVSRVVSLVSTWHVSGCGPIWHVAHLARVTWHVWGHLARVCVVRQVSFEFMNQQLVWSGMSDFLLHVMPLINFAKLRRFLRWCFGYSRGREKEAPTTVSLGVSSCGICGVSPCRTPFL
ncbi:MAG: hypothetical protein MHM6MM_006802, partial [Cercozoa sp. M6MM]